MAFFQFSLRRLLIGVTIVCMVCAAAVGFPRSTLEIGLLIGTFAPATAVALLLSAPSKRKGWLFSFAMFGAVIGFFLTPFQCRLVPAHDFYQAAYEVLYPIYDSASYAAIGALLVGGTLLSIEYCLALPTSVPRSVGQGHHVR